MLSKEAYLLEILAPPGSSEAVAGEGLGHPAQQGYGEATNSMALSILGLTSAVNFSEINEIGIGGYGKGDMIWHIGIWYLLLESTLKIRKLSRSWKRLKISLSQRNQRSRTRIIVQKV